MSRSVDQSLIRQLNAMRAEIRRLKRTVQQLAGSATTIVNTTGTTGSSSELDDHESETAAHHSKTVSADIDHNQTTNNHNLTTDIDHNQTTNNHNLTTDIDHGSISGLADDDHTQYHNDSRASTWFDANKLKDEDNMASDSASHVPSQQSIKAYVDQIALIGSGNAAWVNCIAEGDASGNFAEVRAFGGTIKNNGSTNMNISFVLPLPSTIGSLNLTIAGLRIHVIDADSNDYINQTRIFHVDQSANSHVTKYNDGTDILASGLYEDGDGVLSALTPFSIAENDRVAVQILCNNTTTDDFILGSVQLQCYYS